MTWTPKSCFWRILRVRENAYVQVSGLTEPVTGLRGSSRNTRRAEAVDQEPRDCNAEPHLSTSDMEYDASGTPS